MNRTNTLICFAAPPMGERYMVILVTPENPHNDDGGRVLRVKRGVPFTEAQALADSWRLEAARVLDKATAIVEGMAR